MPKALTRCTRKDYEEFLAVTTTSTEPDRSVDGEYLDETWLDTTGQEVAAVTWHRGEAVEWFILQP